MFTMKEEEWKKQSYQSIEYLRTLIRNQISLFPTSKSFDYTTLISKENNRKQYNTTRQVLRP